MSAKNKARNTAEATQGKLKEEVGKLSHDRSMQAEGKADRAKADLKQAGEKVKDAFKD
jgi:uncharacterized protein YjbJ (UPF0337 family)